MTHWERLSEYIPKQAQVLDVGSGRGDFLIEAAKQHANAVGLELNQEYIDLSYKKAQDSGVAISVEHAIAEQMPFSNNSFDFINVAEVIEHVSSPEKVLKEIYRVLKPGGRVYLSVPNRFGFKDPHFHLLFINWMPRILANGFITLFGKHKSYASKDSGLQRITEMHYYTYTDIKYLLRKEGFYILDIRKERIKNEFQGVKRILAMIFYPVLRTLYFNSFHFLLQK